MTDYRIYYDGGATYDGSPENAPAFGVLVVIQKNKDSGRELITSKDYYCWTGNGWLCTDYIGFVDYLAQPGWKRVLFGRMVSNDEWYRVIKQANEDPDFPVRTNWGFNERVVE